MDSFEFSKIAGAVLSALLLIFGLKVIIDSGRGVGHGGAGVETAGYKLPEATKKAAAAAPDAAPQPAAGAAPAKGEAGKAAFDPAAVVAAVATAKPENGEAIFKRCGACHVGDKAAKSTVGPSLWGVVGRKRATRADYTKYSEAMKGKGGEWSLPELASFVHDPLSAVPGTAMKFNGIKEAGEVADLLAYLKTLAD